MLTCECYWMNEPIKKNKRKENKNIYCWTIHITSISFMMNITTTAMQQIIEWTNKINMNVKYYIMLYAWDSAILCFLRRCLNDTTILLYILYTCTLGVGHLDDGDDIENSSSFSLSLSLSLKSVPQTNEYLYTNVCGIYGMNS